MYLNSKKQSAKTIGIAGEKKAVDFLTQSGYTVLECNWRNRHGEVDIIAEKDETLVFAEVKTAPHGTYKTLEYILGNIKQKRIIETAKYFLQDNRQYNKHYIRFDVLIIDMPGYPTVYHIENAFSEFA
ncbi:MAG: YraN family protein [Spirochaetales bacterium]